jgi:hypothetical protein
VPVNDSVMSRSSAGPCESVRSATKPATAPRSVRCADSGAATTPIASANAAADATALELIL